jgi:hypothetical protein
MRQMCQMRQNGSKCVQSCPEVAVWTGVEALSWAVPVELLVPDVPDPT